MTSSLRSVLFALSGALLLQVASCGKDEAPCSGAERCACYPNGTCDTGLTCLSDTCVAPDAGGANSGTGGRSSSGGTTSPRGGGASTEAGMTSSAGAGTADAGADGQGGDTSTGTTGGANQGGALTGGAATRGGANQGGTGTAKGGTGTAQGGSTTDAGAGAGAGAVGADAGAGGSGDTCRAFETYPEGTVPTVFVLVDRSGSMFHCLSSSSTGNCPDQTDSPWTALKSGVLDMVEQLEGTVRFGFGTFAGETTATCPSFDKVPAKLNNYDAISQLYEAVTPPVKGETPTAQVLTNVLAILKADPSPGEKYVLLVTDGEPDFCDDGDSVCPVDAAVAQLQAMHTAGVGTLVFGVDSTLSTISGATLQAFANAGAGEPVAPPLTTATSYQCAGRASWASLFAASGKTAPDSLGAYSSNGTATVFRPDPTDQQALTTLFRGAVSGVKSCLFDLASGLSVDLAQQGRATVAINGQMVARDAANGWSMTSATQLKLNGTACALWRDPASRTIDFNFPCGVVVSR